MRIIVQRAVNASCKVDNKITGQIEKGFMILVGFEVNDTKDILPKMARKIQGLRVFEDSEGKMNLALKDVGGDILSISQFTLYGDASHGFRPSFINAMKGEDAIKFYEEFNDILRNEYGLKVETGIFGADMKINFTNDGPVTIILDSKEL